MEREDVYVGFPSLPEESVIVRCLLQDPPEVRWRMVRELFHIKERSDRERLIAALQPHFQSIDDYRIKYRLHLALQALHRPLNLNRHILVKGQGAYRKEEFDPDQARPSGETNLHSIQPVIDFHIHPKTPDLKYFSDMREAGVTHGVILATDTDPDDVERPEIREMLRQRYDRSPLSRRQPFDSLLRHIRASLYSPTHVTNQDVADWVADYPERLIGFGSVNLSKDRDYVVATLDRLANLKMRGVKFLPHSQFFDPGTCEHMDVLMDYCRDTGSIVLSHTGCGPGPFEIPELSSDSHPGRWEPVLKAYPEVPVVFAHFGSYSKEIPGIWLFDALELGKKYKNVYADLAAVDWLLDRENVVKEIRKTIGFGRVLFATDYPLPLTAGLTWSYVVNGITANTHMSEKEKRKVLGENAARLLRMD